MQNADLTCVRAAFARSCVSALARSMCQRVSSQKRLTHIYIYIERERKR